jgi:hypothetical protein
MARPGRLAVVVASALASGAAAQDPPTPPECGRPDASIAAALGAYEAAPEKIADDTAPVADAAFEAALAGARNDNDDAVRWRQRPPDYPVAALAETREAACAAAFDVATSGRTMNIAVSCTDLRFEAGVRRSVAGMLFLPKKANGAAVVARRLVQPYSFCLAD